MKTKADETIESCEVGDILYRVGKHGITKITIIEIDHFPHCVYRDDQGHSYFNHTMEKSCFKTKEEAEREVFRRECITKKRTLLKNYEEELNKRFCLEDHFIVK